MTKIVNYKPRSKTIATNVLLGLMNEGCANTGPQLGEHASYVREWVESSLLQIIMVEEGTPLDLGFFYLGL